MHEGGPRAAALVAEVRGMLALDSGSEARYEQVIARRQGRGLVIQPLYLSFAS